MLRRILWILGIILGLALGAALLGPFLISTPVSYTHLTLPTSDLV